MRAMSRIFALAAAFALALSVAAPGASAATEEEARKLVEEGKCGDAIPALREAFEATKKADLKRLMGECYEKLGQIGTAISAYQEYLLLAKDPDDKSAIEAKIEELKSKSAGSARGMGKLDVHVNVDGADIKVDGVKKGESPIEPLSLSEGLYEVGVEKSGFPNWLGTANIVSGETLKLDVELAKPKKTWPIYVGVAVGVVVVAAGVGLGVYFGRDKLPVGNLGDGTINF